MSEDYNWRIPLSKTQKLNLDKSIVEYVDWHITNNNTQSSINNKQLIQRLNQLFQIDDDDESIETQQGQLLLPRKWNSIVQLQRKIMILEDNIKQLNIQLDILKENSEPIDKNNTEAQIWLPKSQPFNSFIVESPITTIKLHPLLPYVIIGTNHGKLYLYDLLNTSIPIASIYAHTKAITSIDIYIPRDNDQTINIITSSKDLNIRSWSWNSTTPQIFKLEKTLMDHDHIISQIKTFNHFNNNLPMIVSCSRDKTIKIWNLLEGFCMKTIKDAHSDWIRSIDVLGQYILSGSNDTSVRLTHWPTGNGLSIGLGHDFPIEKVLFIPYHNIEDVETLNYNDKIYYKMGFKFCLTAGRDNMVKMWEIPIPNFTINDIPIPNINSQSNQFKLFKEFKGHTSWVRDIKLSAKGPYFFSCSDDKSLRMWNLETGECIRTWLDFHSGFINCIDTDIELEGRDLRKLLVSGGIDCKCNILMN